jgi:UDP-N-acetylmuramoyl-tripeptide--D-alanyl-D-alanine ligase
MAVRLSDEQVQQATQGTRVRQGSRASFSAVCTDSRHLTPGCLFVAIVGERFDGHDFVEAAAQAGAAGVVVQRGRPVRLGSSEVALYEVADTLAALGALARFHRQRFRIPVAAVTGSNGKTTTKELVAAILATRGPALRTSGNLNNEVGVPLTLFDLEPRHVAAVVELGMNHPGEIARLTALVRPDAGLITAVQPAHLEGLGTLEGVAAAKGELFRGLEPGGTAVVNLDDARVAAQASGLGCRQLTYGRAPRAQVRLEAVVPRGLEGLELDLALEGRSHRVRLKLVGEHNALNATGAFALATALGYPPEACVQGLEAARPHARRLELKAAAGGVTVLDDCYNANPASMAAALDTLQALAGAGRPVAVLGDMLELGAEEAAEHARLGALAAARVARVAFFGPRSRAAHGAARPLLGGAAAHFEELEPLLAWLRGELRPGDLVLVKGSRGMRLERVVDALTGAPASGGH